MKKQWNALLCVLLLLTFLVSTLSGCKLSMEQKLRRMEERERAYALMELIDENGEAFFRIIRDAHPDVPVIFIEDVIFPYTIFDNAIREQVENKNAAQKRLYTKLKKAGEKRIYYISAEGMIGEDGEATVDGTHFTDLGMMRYVDHVLPTIKKALR